MNFKEAMGRMKLGIKVTRRKYEKERFFIENKNGGVECYERKIEHFNYDQSIMNSDGWRVIGNDTTYNFFEAYAHMKAGAYISLGIWDDSFIYINKENIIIWCGYMRTPYYPTTLDFDAEDWMEFQVN